MKTQEVGDLYDKKISGEYKFNYENKRWFSTPERKMHYEMAREAILYLLNLEQNQHSQILEMGPGPGTWTKVLMEKNPKASFTLVDVSKEMLALAKENLKNSSIKFVHSGFLESNVGNIYDFFFSSRALEYIQDKKAFAEKLASLMNSDGSGIIITKNPKYVRAFLRGRKISNLHKDQIKPKLLHMLLKNAGFEVLNTIPVTFNFPFMKNRIFGRILSALFGKRALTPINSIFTESYAVRFKKI